MIDTATKDSPEGTPLSAFVDNVRQNLVPMIKAATVPFFAVQNRRIERTHTGVFLTLGLRHLLLTASHDWKEINSIGLPVLAGWDDEEDRPIQLAGTDFHLADPSTYDVAVATLTDEQAALLKKRFSPIRVSQLCPKDDDEHGIYILCGYPRDPTQVNGGQRVVTPCLTYICYKFTEERQDDPLSSFKFDPHMHCLFSVEGTGIDAVTHNDVQIPKNLSGISGCGIWKIGRQVGGTLYRYAPEHVELCAIEHRYNEQRGYVVATWIERVVEGIMHRHLDTRNIFRMFPNNLKWRSKLTA